MAKEGDNSFGVLSVAFGILSIVLPVVALLGFGFVGGISLGVLGLIFGIVQRKKVKNSWSMWGIILSIVGLLVSLFVLQQVIVAVGQASQILQDLKASGGLVALQEGVGTGVGSGY